MLDLRQPSSRRETQSDVGVGLSRPWPEALKTMTVEDKMDATAIIDYFAPLKTWLDAENQKAAR
jgi:peptidyl-dipeptidase A